MIEIAITKPLFHTTDLAAGGRRKEPRARAPGAAASRELLRLEARDEGQEPEAVDGGDLRLDVMRVLEPRPEHLAAPADPEHRLAAPGAGGERVGEAAGAQPDEVGDGGLRPGGDEEVGAAGVGGALDEAEPHPRLLLQ